MVLLAATASMAAPDRISHLVAVARERAETDPEGLVRLLDQMLDGDVHARVLAVTMASATGQAAVLDRAVGDEHPAVAARAVTARGTSSATLRTVAVDGSLAMRRLARRCLVQRPGAVDDALLRAVRERWGDTEVASLLAGCRAEVVAAWLPGLVDAISSWGPLVGRHLTQVVAVATDELGRSDTTWWWQERRALVATLLKAHPDVVLDLAQRYPARTLPAVLQARLSPLVRTDPRRTLALMSADERQEVLGSAVLSRRAARRLAGLSDAEAGSVLRDMRDGTAGRYVWAGRWCHRLTRTTLLRAVPPARRPAVWDVAHQDTATATAVLDDVDLALLPWRRRHAEARRMLTLGTVAEDPARTRAVAAFLPVDDAVEVLEPATRSADADERADGYRLLVHNAIRSRDTDRTAALLRRLAVRLRNERDPVRQIALEALSELPHPWVAADCLESLGTIVTDAREARDVSSTSLRAASRLVFGLLASDDPSVKSWALTMLRQTVATRDTSFELPGPETWSTLRPLQQLEVWDALRPQGGGRLRRGDASVVLWVAEMLGRHGWAAPGLADMLADATTIAHDGVARRAARLYLADPSTRAERAGRLVSRDASFVQVDQVLRVLVTHRTDLLDTYVLAKRPLKGRFATRGVWIADASPGEVLRWTPQQTEGYCGLLAKGVSDRKATQRAWWLRRLVTMPGFVATETAEALAGDDTVMLEAMLTGLGRAAVPARALPTLMDHLDGDRARVAVYSSSRCLRWLPPDQVAQVATDLLTSAKKVQVRKEAARLLGLHHVAPDVLLGVLQPGEREEHRDVRVAAITALGSFLDRPQTRQALARTAADADGAVAASVLSLGQAALTTSARAEYARLVCTVASHPDGKTAQAGMSALPRWYRWSVPEARATTLAALTDLDRQDVWRSAALVASASQVWDADDGLPVVVADALLRMRGTGPDAGPERDLPARQRLGSLLTAWTTGSTSANPLLREHPEATAALADLLAAAGLCTEAAWCRLALATPARPDHLLAAADLLADRPVACSAAGTWIASQAAWGMPETSETVTALSARGDGAAAWLALGLVTAAGRKTGWASPWPDHLRALRRRSDPELADAASEVVTATE